MTSDARPTRLPRGMTAAVLLASTLLLALPGLERLRGGFGGGSLGGDGVVLLHGMLHGVALTVALLAAVLSFGHHLVKGTGLGPVVGVTLSVAAAADLSHLLAADGPLAPGEQGGHATGSCLLAGALAPLALLGAGGVWTLVAPRRARSAWAWIAAAAALALAGALVVFHVGPALDASARAAVGWGTLVLLLLAGALVALRLRRDVDDLLSQALLLALLPLLGARLVVLPGVVDDLLLELLVSHLLGLVAFGTLLAGLVLEHAAAWRAERTSQERLEQAEDLRDHFFDLSNDLLCIANFEGFFVDVNDAWIELLGYTRDELLSRPFLEFVVPEDREATRAEAAGLARGADTISFQNRYQRADGRAVWLLWKAASVPESRHIFAVARDITPLREAEAELRASKEQAEAASRAKSEFLATMSHELRTPLNSVIGFANVLLRRSGRQLSERERLYLQRIRDNGSHLLSLINAVLDLSKVEAGRLELQLAEVDVRELVRETLALLESQLEGREVVLETEFPAALRPLRTDPGRLKQVLINLVANALRFTERGRVLVALRADSAGHLRRIDVVDTGLGIPADRLARVFEAFEQAESGSARSHGGTGLGLTIARNLCHHLGYRLEVVSVEGRGSTFSVVTPEPASLAS